VAELLVKSWVIILVSLPSDSDIGSSGIGFSVGVVASVIFFRRMSSHVSRFDYKVLTI